MIELPPGFVVLEPHDSVLLVRALRLLAALSERSERGRLPAELLQLRARMDRAVRVSVDAAGLLGDQGSPPVVGSPVSRAAPERLGTSELPQGAGGAGSAYDLDARQAARLLGCSDRNVRALARRGTLPGHLVGRSWRFTVQDVVEHRDHQLRSRPA